MLDPIHKITLKSERESQNKKLLWIIKETTCVWNKKQLFIWDSKTQTHNQLINWTFHPSRSIHTQNKQTSPQFGEDICNTYN